MDNGEGTKKTPKSSFFWDTDKKQPSKYSMIIIMLITIMMLAWLSFDALTSVHDIKIEIDYDGQYHGIIEYGDDFHNIAGGFGDRKFSLNVPKGTTIWVYIYKDKFSSDPVGITFYDNGMLASQNIFTEYGSSCEMSYYVG
jgi:hypothetical protein